MNVETVSVLHLCRLFRSMLFVFTEAESFQAWTSETSESHPHLGQEKMKTEQLHQQLQLQHR